MDADYNVNKKILTYTLQKQIIYFIKIMKLKSLLLTSMVALALGACSNANDAVENAETKTDAAFSFSIAMPASSASSRAVEAGGTNAGSDAENKLTKVAIVLKYSTNGSADVTKTFNAADFTCTQNDADKTVVYTLNDDKKIEIAAGTFTAYAVVNGGMVELGATITKDYGTDLAGLTSNVAKDNEFMMSGFKTDNTVDAGHTVTAKINVDRVVAKIQEVSTNSEFTTTVKTTDNDAIIITLQNFTLLNLNRTSNVFTTSDGTNTLDYANYSLATSSADQFGNYFLASQTNSFAYSTATAKTINNATVYCFENSNAALSTKVVYAAKISGTDIVAGKNLYVKDGKLYKSFKALDDAFDNIYSKTWKLNDESSSYEQFLNAGVKQYAGGICYYVQNIMTAGTTATAKIVRNNWYKLNVKSISGLGLPVVDPKEDVDPTMLDLEIIVNPWTVNTNSFDL
jgi:hypothetical protein